MRAYYACGASCFFQCDSRSTQVMAPGDDDDDDDDDEGDEGDFVQVAITP